MTAVLLRVGGLVAIYLLVLTSLAPGDVLVGGLLAVALVVVSRTRGPWRDAAGWGRWSTALVRMIVATTQEIVSGTVRVVRFCLAGTGSPGFVEIPRGGRAWNSDVRPSERRTDRSLPSRSGEIEPPSREWSSIPAHRDSAPAHHLPH